MKGYTMALTIRHWWYKFVLSPITLNVFFRKPKLKCWDKCVEESAPQDTKSRWVKSPCWSNSPHLMVFIILITNINLNFFKSLPCCGCSALNGVNPNKKSRLTYVNLIDSQHFYLFLFLIFYSYTLRCCTSLFYN